MVRTKEEWADLKRRYPKVFRWSVGITFLTFVVCAVVLPPLHAGSAVAPKKKEPLQIEMIPPTSQTKRPPPPPRPAVPIETEDVDVPDDVTIAETDLDFDAPIVDVVPPQFDAPAEEEEIMEFWYVEDKPKVIHRVTPVYPELAKRAGLEGQVVLSFVVTTNGRATEIVVLRGAEIFRAAAIEAVAQFRFRPAKQNDRSVPVRMTIPMRFRLH